MGLENGILIKMDDYSDVDMEFPGHDTYDGEWLPVYFRKAFGVREDMIDLLCSECGHTYDRQGGEIDLEKEDIPKIIKLLKKYTSVKYFDRNARSIFEGEDVCDSVKQMVSEMEYLYKYLTEKPESVKKMYFFDSY